MTTHREAQGACEAWGQIFGSPVTWVVCRIKKVRAWWRWNKPTW